MILMMVAVLLPGRVSRGVYISVEKSVNRNQKYIKKSNMDKNVQMETITKSTLYFQ